MAFDGVDAGHLVRLKANLIHRRCFLKVIQVVLWLPLVTQEALFKWQLL